MPLTLLAAKLSLPPLRPKTVLRPHLIEQLNAGLPAGLTLISAPAGFGKTTLVRAWAAACKRPVAWLSLDEGDADLAGFLSYLVAALQTLDGHIGTGALGLLRAAQPQPPTESILTALLNDVTAFHNNFLVVLDDFHLIRAKPIDDALTYLVEHLPPQMHLVIATREDPHLPLARLRARGRLTELRAADLRFTPAEAADFLNQVMGLNLSPDDIAALEARTEGWIAGLQLAALSLHGRTDPARFIQAFTGSHRFVLDYLVDEVLERQPEPVRRFLLQTAILDQLSAPLCGAVAERDDGQAMLEVLERGNVFVAPLDDHRHWYRYHHLFAEVLQARVMAELPDLIPSLHRRASLWYAQNGLPAEAIRHALAAADFDLAAAQLELAWPHTDDRFHHTTWLAGVRALPAELVRARPVLSVWYAHALLATGDLEGAQARLAEAERWLESGDPVQKPAATQAATLVIVDERQLQTLPATIAIGRAYCAQALGDGPSTVQCARQALDLLPADDQVRRGQATALLGLAYWANGNLEAADRIFSDYTRQLRSAGNLPDAISTAFVVADIRMALGRLREAAGTLEQMLQNVVAQGGSVPPETADLYRGLGDLYREWGDLDAAARSLLSAQELGEHTGLFDWPHRLYVAQARLHQSQGDLEGALQLLDQAEGLFVRTPLPDVHPLAARRTRIWIAQGRLTEALAWARERGLSVDDTPNYLREFEHVTLARLLIAQHTSEPGAGSIREAIGLLERLLSAAEAGRRLGSVIKILVVLALAHEAAGSRPAALGTLERALMLAEPEGYVRIFVDEGPPMERLLHAAAARGTAPDYVQRLLAAFHPAAPAPTRPYAAQSTSAEPLSEREREVLHHIAEGLTNREIADRLYLSLYTVKAHARSIYAKLEANNRTQAVAKARELGILPRV
ncbi:MAG: AAA family ATPase [Anaerolineales bacterium]|nr:AAA family ATPase [Anaerolineales bacterium]